MNLINSKLWNLVFLAMFILLGTSCSSLDGKIAFGVQEQITQLIEKTPTSVEWKGNHLELNELEEDQVNDLAKAVVETLAPVQEKWKIPKGGYYILTYQLNEQSIHLYVPAGTIHHPEKEIYVDIYDNSHPVYYRLVGGEQETQALVEWLNDKIR